MMSLYDYQGHPDKDGTGKKLNAYAKLRKQPYEQRELDLPTYKGKVFLYTEEFIKEYFQVENIINPELPF
tara:strand:- start:246 stop:455 length:210 start_codon:yes stop_codon:yes gene_type:complete